MKQPINWSLYVVDDSDECEYVFKTTAHNKETTHVQCYDGRSPHYSYSRYMS